MIDGSCLECHNNQISDFRFYSSRNVEYEDYIETEKIPSDPDAIVSVID